MDMIRIERKEEVYDREVCSCDPPRRPSLRPSLPAPATRATTTSLLLPPFRLTAQKFLGRDTASVFPTEAAKEAERKSGMPMLDKDAVEEILGTKNKFVTESELRALTATRDPPADASTSQSLYEQLQKHKDAKAELAAERERLRKQGKNRPLTEEEIEFIEGVQDQSALVDLERRVEEQKALAKFQMARQVSI